MIDRRRKPLNRLLIVVFLCCANIASAASIFDLGERHFASIGDHKTINGGIVSALTQDSQGFIWVGGQQGAMRYDGYQFKLFKHDVDDPNSLAGNYIKTIWSAPDGKIWFGTFGDGISVFNPDVQQFDNFTLTKSDDDYSYNAIHAIVGETAQRFWVATNGGLSFVNPMTKQSTNIARINGCGAVYKEQGVRSLKLDGLGGLWIGTQNGLCRVNLPSQNHQKDALLGKSFPKLDGNGIHSLLFTSEQHLWLGTVQNGLAKFDIKNATIEWLDQEQNNLGDSWVVSIIRSSKTEVWVGTLDNGISVIDIDTFKVKQHIRHDKSLPGTINLNNIGALYRDKDGLIWVGTWGSGLNLFDPQLDSIRTIRHSHDKANTILPAKIRAITETDNNEIWLGYNQAGISRISLSDGKIETIEPNPDKPGALTSGDILSLQHTQNGEVWIGTRSAGLIRYDPKADKFISYEELVEEGLRTVTGFTIESQERMWIATSRGMWWADLTTKQVAPLSGYAHSERVAQKVVYSSAWQKPDSLWMGTNEGLFHLSTSSKIVSLFHPQKSNTINLSDNSINSLMADHNNILWVATESGLDKLSDWDGETAEFTSIHQMLDIENDYIANIQPDYKGRIWYHKGVFDIQQKRMDRLDDSDAWSIGTIWLGSSIKTKDDKILYGGTDGLLIIDPENYEKQETKAAVNVTRLQVDNQDKLLPDSEPLILTPENQSVVIEFSALEYSRSQTILYAWRLIGFDTDWINGDAANRRATYTNIPPGTYDFMVKHRSSNQDWSEDYRLQTIKILPAWYETSIAWLGFLFLLSGIIWSFFYARTHQLLQQKQNLDEQIQQKTKELSQANLDKDRIMSILAHDINNKVAISMGYLDLLKLSINTASPEELENYIEKAINSGKGCAELVSELRDFGKLSSESNQINLEYTNLIEITQNIIDLHQPVALKKNINLVYKQTSGRVFCGLHQNKFARILENLLSNAIKFSHQHDQIVISISTANNSAILTIEDKGIGIPQDIQNNLFTNFIQTGRAGTCNESSTGLGLYIVKKLVDQHKGKLWFTSQENKGTTFFVELPLV